MEEKDKVWIEIQQLNRAIENLLDQYQGIVGQYEELRQEPSIIAIYDAAKTLARKQSLLYESYKSTKTAEKKADIAKMN